MQDYSTKSDGSQYTASEFNDLHVECENFVTDTGQTLSAADPRQMSKTAANYAGGGDFYTDGGSANTYVLSVVGSKQGPTAYVDGLRVRFNVGNTNTSASTINVNSIGAVAVEDLAGSALVGGELIAGDIVELVYNNANGSFTIVGGAKTKTFSRIVTKSADYTILDNDQIGVIIASGSGTDITLPTPGDNIGRIIAIKRVDASNNISIRRDNSNDTIDGFANDFFLTGNLQSITLIAQAANTWYIV